MQYPGKGPAVTVIQRYTTSTLVILLLFIGLQGCAVCLPSVFYDLEAYRLYRVSDLPLTIYHLEEDQGVLPLVEAAVRAGLVKASRWGTLSRPVIVTVYPNHLELEKAVQRRGYPWLKAWATADGISLQSPRSWPLLKEEHLFQLMAHELTHVVHYQTAGITGLEGARKDPFWFGEGLASFTAGQDAGRYDAKTLLRKLKWHRDFDPLSPTPEDIRVRQKLSYSSAHHLVGYLIGNFGDQAVRKLLARMAAGESFRRAFERTYALSPERFRDRWLQWLESVAAARAGAQVDHRPSASVVRSSRLYYDGDAQRCVHESSDGKP